MFWNWLYLNIYDNISRKKMKLLYLFLYLLYLLDMVKWLGIWYTWTVLKMSISSFVTSNFCWCLHEFKITFLILIVFFKIKFLNIFDYIFLLINNTVKISEQTGNKILLLQILYLQRIQSVETSHTNLSFLLVPKNIILKGTITLTSGETMWKSHKCTACWV